jgi:hypothetical protein
MARRIALVTDFGPAGPYLGQVRGVLDAAAPSIPVFDLVSDLPAFRPELAAYLLPQLGRDLPGDTLYLCVVDPGVGSERAVLVLQADENWYLGPDNGLLAIVARRAAQCRVWRVDWRPVRLSASFHGRDLLAPLAAALATGGADLGPILDVGRIVGHDWPDDMLRVIYRDAYGNLCSGVRADRVGHDVRVMAGGYLLSFARTFSEVPVGAAFWYENAFGLLELAVNQGAADQVLGLVPGDALLIES